MPGTRRSYLLSAVSLCGLAGCAAGPVASDGAGGREAAVDRDSASVPAVQIDRATVRAVRTDPRAVEEVLGAGAQHRGVDVVRARLDAVRVENPDDVPLPATVASGETVTLVFLRSARPARLTRLPANASGTAPADATAARPDPDTRVVAVDAAGDRVDYRLRDDGVDSRTVRTLPGLDAGDEFAATARPHRGALVVTAYEVTSER